MTRQSPNQSRKGIVTSASIATGGLIALGLLTILIDDQPPSSSGPPAQPVATTTAQATAGWRAYIDPETGELTDPPAGSAESQSEAAAFSTSHAGLRERPSPVPGGGMILDLQGRFRSPLVATRGADGKLTIRHPATTRHSDDAADAE